MKAATLFLVVSIAAFGGVASAQTGSQSGPDASLQSPRAPYRKACQNDMKSLCPSTQGGRNMLACLRANQDKLSSECQKALAQLPARAAPAPSAPAQN
ncbi:MAG TPA: hypothetical protein VHY19_13335 [Steroidobacteraceae bacterium]|jgi:hypothetical protein|nr:hypothetical protein [Steroidobacteraceae bacterium]